MCMGMEDTSISIPGTNPMKFYLSFTILCDNFIDHRKIDGLNYTDEIDCEKDWPCNNIYTRCDGKWNCHNAIDEANCPYNPWHPNGHPCILPFHHNFTCLSLSRINDGRIDCLGGDDEQDRCGAIVESAVGYMSSRCENLETKIEFHFAKSISIPQMIFIHFVYFPPESSPLPKIPPDPIQVTIMSKLKFHESSTTVYYGGAFHLVFVEFYQQYYLALLQHNFTSVINISTSIIPEHQCFSIKDLFTVDIRILSRWHRAKKYHIPFDYPSTYRCLGYNYCENNGQCFQDNNTCPTLSACLCKECYYGGRCQFTTTGFGLSLDDILGYNIWPSVPFSRQPIVVKITTAFTVLIFVIAIINSILSIITFQRRDHLK
ncbi:unnamed protein product [Rotaria sp. Silwood1]|nr:unnamed protein product [Rotaria sp. Silwood1]